MVQVRVKAMKARELSADLLCVCIYIYNFKKERVWNHQQQITPTEIYWAKKQNKQHLFKLQSDWEWMKTATIIEDYSSLVAKYNVQHLLQ